MYPTEIGKLIEPIELIRDIIRIIGDDPARPGLKDTPDRVVRSWDELFSGYGEDPKSIMTVFEEKGTDEMVILKGVEVISVCEHHMLPFTGVAHVAYIPKDNRVLGISKLARIVDVFARRLQLQERLTDQVTDALMGEPLLPLGAACVIQATHSCMACRGIRQRPQMITSSLKGVFRQSEVRAELFQLIRGVAE